MKLLDGKVCAESLVAEISKRVAGYVDSGLRKPHMTVILVGEHAPSESYVKSKIKSCDRAGFESALLRFPESISEPDLLAKLLKSMLILLLTA